MNQNNDDKGIDFSDALDDSSSKIKFKGEQFQRPARSYYPGTPKVIQWVIKYSGGLVKDRKQAIYVLLGFFILAVVIFSIIVFSGGPKIPEKARENPEYGLPIKD